MTQDQAAYDLVIRLQVYLEGYKNGRADVIDAVMARVSRDLRGILAAVPVDQLSDLTRKEVRDLTAKLEAAQAPVYEAMSEEILGELDEGSYELSLLVATALAGITALATVPAIPRNPGGSSFSGATVGVSGATPRELMSRYVGRSKQDLIDLVNKGYTDKLTIAEVLKSILGTRARNYKDGLLNRTFNNGMSTTRTLVQWWKVRAVNTAMAPFTDRYRWVSILDNKTTQICIDRHGLIYVRGKGPLAPAHYNCRSDCVPFFGDDSYSPETFTEWFAGQPEKVQKELIGSRLWIKVQQNALDIGQVRTRLPKLTKEQLLSKKLTD